MSMLRGSISGRIARDAEVKTTPKGDTICEFSVPHQEQRDGPTTWVRCSIWGKRGQALAPHLAKGTSVTVVGSLKVREYDGKNGRAFSVELKADDIALLGGGKRDGVAEPSRYGRAGGGSAKHTGTPDGDDYGAADDSDLPF